MLINQTFFSCFFFLICTCLFFFLIFLAALGLRCGTWESFIVGCGLFVAACGLLFLLAVVCGFSLSSCDAQAPERVDSVVCSMQALVEAGGLSSCGAWA